MRPRVCFGSLWPIITTAALRNLGHLYRLGQGVAKNGKKARCYYEKAAKLGHAPSQTNLAQMYFSGALIARDSEKAMYWLEKAAAQGYPPARQLLAIKTQNFEFHSRQAFARRSLYR